MIEDDRPKSRTQKKNEDRALQRLGEELLTLSNDQLAAVEMPEELTEAVQAGRQITSHGARRRQLQYIGALMRKIDPSPIRRALDGIRQGDIRQALVIKQLEAWRDALQAGNLTILEEILKQCPQADRQRLTQLTRNARQQPGSPKATKASRMLFRYLREVYR